MRFAYVAGYDRPAILLDDKPVGGGVDEAAADALMGFCILAAAMAPTFLRHVGRVGHRSSPQPVENLALLV